MYRTNLEPKVHSVHKLLRISVQFQCFLFSYFRSVSEISQVSGGTPPSPSRSAADDPLIFFLSSQLRTVFTVMITTPWEASLGSSKRKSSKPYWFLPTW